LSVFVNHLKSNFVRFDDPDPAATRARNHARRTRQSEVVRRVVDAKTRPNSRYVVLGDMNDAPDSDTLEPFAARLVDGLFDVVESAPPPPSRNPEDVPIDHRWTHRLSQSRAPDRFELLDQIWLSPALAPKLDHAEIDRRRAWSATAAGVGSDHDPAWIRLSGL
jgi:endonuclease/exonuclease/phosphatase family metal-dependent hydrolase